VERARVSTHGFGDAAVSSVALPIALGLAGAALAYLLLAILVVWRWYDMPADGRGTAPPSVSVLKPLCDLEPNLEECLRSFCDQSYPDVQILFGTRTGDDPALTVARRFAAEFPQRDIQVLAGAPPVGGNRKVNTLVRLSDAATREVLVIADSDIRVGRDYLARVTPLLEDPSVGLVTCLYRGAPSRSLWARLAALAIDEWFLPSVLVSRALGSQDYCSGATMVLRRRTLEEIGGFRVLADVLADDFELGARVRALGLRTVIAGYEVTTTVDESGLGAMLQHELRWNRTIRTVRPPGHFFSFVTYGLPMTALPVIVAGRGLWGGGLVLLPPLALALRAWLHYLIWRPARREGWSPPGALGAKRAPLWMLPVGDVLSFLIWLASFASRRVTWRRQALHVGANGQILPEETLPT